MKYKVNINKTIYESTWVMIEADNNDAVEAEIRDLLDDPNSLIWDRKSYNQINCSVKPEVGEPFDILDPNF